MFFFFGTVCNTAGINGVSRFLFVCLFVCFGTVCNAVGINEVSRFGTVFNTEGY